MKKNETETYIINPKIEEYLRNLNPIQDNVLKEMEELGNERGFPIIGPLVGSLLYQLAIIIGAKRVFDMGSGFGYSAYWFAKALGKEGLVIFAELSEKNAWLAREFFRRGGLDNRVEIHVGDALQILEETDGEFDVIFNDIDKEYYPLVVDEAYKKLRRGGLFITDNVLWFGRVLTDDLSPSTKGVKEFTRLLFEEKGFVTTIIPIRDGISLSVKL
ncbi:MAG: O-methyltransferase family protein [Candidatus Dadabacteria bacterium CSP1-2]|nr:MAG: O-methyltransferase family protein [Candidatus Dadabacteria bacterium CSP1-2]